MAFLRAATAPNIDGRTIELGSGALVSISDIVDQLIALTGTNIKPLFGALPDRPGEQERAADTATASELLGWRATTALNSGLRQTVNWFRAEMKAGKPRTAVDLGMRRSALIGTTLQKAMVP